MVGLDAAPFGIEVFRDEPAMAVMWQMFAVEQVSLGMPCCFSNATNFPISKLEWPIVKTGWLLAAFMRAIQNSGNDLPVC